MLLSGFIGDSLDKFAFKQPPLIRDDALAMLRSGECRVMIRVESKNGDPGCRQGAYRNGAVDRCIYEVVGGMSDINRRHPVPSSDAGIAGTWHNLCRNGQENLYYFGFSKFSQYKNWFFVEDRLKDEEEYSVLGVYIVSREFSHVGQFQMIAHVDEMIHLMDLPLTYKLDATLQELYDAQENSNAR